MSHHRPSCSGHGRPEWRHTFYVVLAFLFAVACALLSEARYHS